MRATKMVQVHTKPNYYSGTLGSPIGAKPNPRRKYIWILAKCQNYTTTHEIYPHTKNVMLHQLYSLEAAGYLARYSLPKYIKPNSCYAAHKTWWKTTPKGHALVAKAILNG